MPSLGDGNLSDKPSPAAVRFDLRRNLINVLGEEHYPYGEFLYHELAANAWDGDASEVQLSEEVTRPASPSRTELYEILVADNGVGMDLDGLREYFTVGESSKPSRGKSEVRGRDLIGRIGVGKVSILKVARAWRITTERHLGLSDPVRLSVRVDIDDWISGKVEEFTVDYLPPTGKSGTEILLHDVHIRLREDRILRHLQRLPLGDDFMIWRNGELVAPRRWFGINRVEIDTFATWTDGDRLVRAPVRGEIWLRPELPGKERAYVSEPKSERDGLHREPAGIEVRVNRDMITREFFGHEHHGHAVNRIWGWVEVPWLPILGNRTDYLRDSREGQAFYDAVKPLFDDVYNSTVRYRKDARVQKQRAADQDEPSADGGDEQPQGVGYATASQKVEVPAAAVEENETLASRYAQVLNTLLTTKPELAPVIEQPPVTTAGRPAKDRLYPVRRTGEILPFVEDEYGEDVAVVDATEIEKSTRAVAGMVKRAGGEGVTEAELGEVKVNTAAGVKLRFTGLGSLEAPYRWNLSDPTDLTLDINSDHKLYLETERPGSALHRLYCAWIVALALAERSHPVSSQGVADFLETLSYELFTRWGPRRQRASLEDT